MDPGGWEVPWNNPVERLEEAGGGWDLDWRLQLGASCRWRRSLGDRCGVVCARENLELSLAVAVAVAVATGR